MPIFHSVRLAVAAALSAMCLAGAAAPVTAPAPIAPTAAGVLPPWTPEQEERVADWRKARFGIFVHWGIYAVPGRGEWVQWQEQIPLKEYAKLADQFKPDAFNADDWAGLFKAAGAKYAVFTARHHDGFAMFDTKAGDFSSVKTAAGRDFVAEFVKAMRKARLGVGLYYSPMDWRFPGYFFPDMQRESAEAMREQYHQQMRELLSNYGKLDVIWFDGGQHYWLNFMGDWTPDATWRKRERGKPYPGGFNYHHEQVYAMLRQLQPQAVINGRADMVEDFHSREGIANLGNFDSKRPWELCATINGAWGWKPDQPVMSLRDVVQLLAETAGRDGNLLLNVGPRPDGQIAPPEAARLREIGAWLKRNGESIYNTRGGPFMPGDFGVATHAGKNIYIHALRWPEQDLNLPALDTPVVGARTLSGARLAYTQTAQGIKVVVPMAQRDWIDTVVVLELAHPIATVSVTMP